MGAATHGLSELLETGAPIYLIVILVALYLVAIHGHKWLDVILKNNRETKKILNEDARRNAKFQLEINEKILKINERQTKIEAKAKEGKK